LTLHRVTNGNGQSVKRGLPTISISVENFESLIRFIKKYYKVISVSEYLQYVRNEIGLSENCLILSFDDGYKEVLDNALPLLKKHGLPAVLFIPVAAIEQGSCFWWDALYAGLSENHNGSFELQGSDDPAFRPYVSRMKKIAATKLPKKAQAIYDFIEALQNSSANIRGRVVDHIRALFRNSNNHNPQLPGVLNWQEVKQFGDSGVEIGSHTVNHQFLSTVSVEEADKELQGSKARLENFLKREVACFSYPGGKYNEEIAQRVEKAGYACAFTSDRGINATKGNLYKLKRLNISDDNVANSRGRFSSAITAWYLFLR